MSQPYGLVLAFGLVCCAPEPLEFRATDASTSEDSSTGEAPTVYLLVRPGVVDSTVEQLRAELEGFGIAHSELTPAEVPSLGTSRSIFVAGFSSVASEWAPVAPQLMASVSAGSWIFLEALALNLVQDASVDEVVTDTWIHDCKDGLYFVKPVFDESSPLFAGLSSWDPPAYPNKSEQSVTQVVANGLTVLGVKLADAGASDWTSALFWELADISPCVGLATSSSYCQITGVCTSKRSVRQQKVSLRQLGDGTIAHLYGIPHSSDLTAWGPVGARIHRNFVVWASAEISGIP